MKFLYLTGFLLISLSSFAQTSDSKKITEELLRSNEIQRTAHLENDAEALVREFADSMITVQNGKITVNSRQEALERFTAYFKTVRYTSWDDITPPRISVSDDGTRATVSVEKLIDAQSLLADGSFSEHDHIRFAWASEYALTDQGLKIFANTSTRQALTAEETASLPINHSTTYAVIRERELVPEGIAYDRRTDITYVSSTYLRKIVAVKPDGTYYDFKPSGEEGLWSTVGMEVDEERNRLWVVSMQANEVLPLIDPDPKYEWTSRIHVYDLSTNGLVSTYEIDPGRDYAFNDITIAKSGVAYVTESVNNLVYLIDPSSTNFKTLEIPDSAFVFPNGITLSDQNRFLYISSSNGILQYDLARESYKFLQKHEGIDDSRIDGLAYYEGTLIANQPYRNRILQFSLDEENGSIKHQKILEANHPSFDQPSTGEVANGSFIYLANAQMQSAFTNGNIKPVEDLSDIVLLKVALESEN